MWRSEEVAVLAEEMQVHFQAGMSLVFLRSNMAGVAGGE